MPRVDSVQTRKIGKLKFEKQPFEMKVEDQLIKTAKLWVNSSDVFFSPAI
jgi:hypothetical protein